VAELVDGDDVGMLEGAGGTRFLIEALEKIRLRALAAGDGLQGDEAVNERIAGFIDSAHGAASEFGDDFVFA